MELEVLVNALRTEGSQAAVKIVMEVVYLGRRQKLVITLAAWYMQLTYVTGLRERGVAEDLCWKMPSF